MTAKENNEELKKIVCDLIDSATMIDVEVDGELWKALEDGFQVHLYFPELPSYEAN